jgi:hypothetical protein
VLREFALHIQERLAKKDSILRTKGIIDPPNPNAPNIKDLLGVMTTKLKRAF